VELMAEPGGTLDFEHIPIERHWGLSMRLHDALGHTEPWEICEAGCDTLASEAICILFGRAPLTNGGQGG
jgi:hypothetical protein